MSTEVDKKPGVYLAGPDGFTPAGLDWQRRVVTPAVIGAGLDALSPWEGPDPFATVAAMAAGAARDTAYRDVDLAVGAANVALIRRAAGVLAVLDGPDVDSGTAAEIGFAAGLGLPVVGLRTDSRRTGDNEGVTVNLQVEFFIALNGGSVHTDVDSAVAAIAACIGV